MQLHPSSSRTTHHNAAHLGQEHPESGHQAGDCSWPILFARTSPACQDCALRQSQLQLSSRRPKGWFQTILLISLLYTTQVKEQAASLQTALLRSDGLRGPR